MNDVIVPAMREVRDRIVEQKRELLASIDGDTSSISSNPRMLLTFDGEARFLETCLDYFCRRRHGESTRR